jgi:glycogen operon protein
LVAYNSKHNEANGEENHDGTDDNRSWDSGADPDGRGHRITDDSFLLLFNAHYEDVTFVLPDRPWGEQWLPDFDTAVVPVPFEPQPAGTKVVVATRDVQIFRRV